jgi:type VI secretion system protein ImpG
LGVDEAAFVGTGLATFTRVLDRFFALYVHANSFTQLTLLSSHSGEVLIRCEPRSGESILV